MTESAVEGQAVLDMALRARCRMTPGWTGAIIAQTGK